MCDFTYDCLFKLFKSYVSSSQTHTHKCRCFCFRFMFLFVLFFWREVRHPVAGHSMALWSENTTCLFFAFWKSAAFLCGTKHVHFEGLFHVLGKHIYSQEVDWEMESHWIPTVIFSLQNYTLFLQRIWFILLSIDKFLNT